MNPKEKNIKIAEACGWKKIEPITIEYMYRAGAMTSGTATWENEKGEPMLEEWIPDFCNDLNAMHKAERSLKIEGEGKYGDLLSQMIREKENLRWGDKPTKKFPFNGWGYFSLAHLTASQKADAFLKTIGLYEEDK